jgi:hypothetical protein
MTPAPSPPASQLFASVSLLATLSLGGTFAGYALLGDSLGLPLLLPFTVPTIAVFAATADTPARRDLVSTAIIAVAGTLPLFFVHGVGMVLAAAALLVAAAFAAAGAARLLLRLRCPESVARCLTLTTLTAWLTWPVWLGVAWTDPAVAARLHPLVPYQPLLAVNGSFVPLGEWAHQPLAYKYLTNLGQDVFYAMPPTAWPAAAVHAAFAAACFGIEGLLARVRKTSPRPA